VQSQQDFPPITLQEAIHDCDCPPLNERIAIAHQLASSLLYFHAVGWLHRALRPDSVIFFREFSPFKSASYIKYSEPSLTNFDYARPDRDGTNTTTSDTARASKFYDLYRHPDYQGTNAQGKFRKSFDIYSFGILLLEIAAWEPIQALVAMEDYEKATSDQMSSISQQATSTELLDRLEQGMGPKYRLAVGTCIKGRGALGLDLADDETDVVVGAKIQRSFTEKVLNALEGIIT
jgi:serine/threonine protein kinase